MKRLICFVLVLLLCTSVVSAVSVNWDNMSVVDGNTVLGVFCVSELTEEQATHWHNFFQGAETMIFGNNDFISFVNLDSSADVKISQNSSDGRVELHFHGADLDEPVGNLFDWELGDDGKYHLKRFWNPLSGRASFPNRYIISCSSFLQEKVTFPAPSSNYVVDITGNLIIKDDLGGETGGSTDEGKQDGILGFLTDFWNNLKDFFIGLFVPADGYFNSWYEEVKTALDNKLSGVLSLYEQLKHFFDDLVPKENSLIIENPFNGGSNDVFDNSAMSKILSTLRGVFTGLIILCCWIYCYKKIIGFVKD